MQTINFNYNYNNKLDCRMYTTMRLSSQKFSPGALVNVTLNRIPHHTAKVVSLREFRISQLTELIAGLDTGYSLTETKNLLYKMYPGVDWQTQPLYLILLEKHEPKQQTNKGT